MATEYSLRQVEDGDIEWLYALNEQCYRDVIVRQFGDWDEEFQRDWFDRKWQRERPARVVMVGSEPIGVVVLERKDSHDWLDEILIKTDYRGQGIGTALMRQIIADAHARDRPVRLRVLKENRSARRLYERIGFVLLEILEHHFLMEACRTFKDR